MRDSIENRLVELQQELGRVRERLAALDAERAQLMALCLRLEGACAVLQEPWAQPLPEVSTELFARDDDSSLHQLLAQTSAEDAISPCLNHS